ncbi:50S ribosomal protein L20 [Mycoplasma flocculare]|uniref:Large ribosomal subunit protein bL20 n=2 Tax=Mesomycoplasma flocculare TaxID=2128 RepID=A0A0A8E7G3_MESFC|nr:50S ribosomal protein L20 [Mesomycoplasma flocculare]MXR39622.1 50S ribosomal protein L20 [Mycoplasma sp. MF12]AJC49929.1 50S ribosomal protein L20 [Mesomycoplasma flocculare ATCC 27399]ENX50899.1 50S ribosomal protein L20 [Mesomycoplasma flocculare ATCC 27716]MXR06026.1 50S ribosomal protein L20 [Mesomycoplasma flocculare]MXR12450.1 50S ribosomal protein L20 [Mesomycoplasma flocculare]
MRVKGGSVTRQRRRRWLKLAKGYWGHKSIGFKVAKQAVIKSWTYSFRDRKQRKRDMRKMWISRINAAARTHGISYSQLMYKIKEANIEINRKMLAEMAIHHHLEFKKIVKLVSTKN